MFNYRPVVKASREINKLRTNYSYLKKAWAAVWRKLKQQTGFESQRITLHFMSHTRNGWFPVMLQRSNHTAALANSFTTKEAYWYDVLRLNILSEAEDTLATKKKKLTTAGHIMLKTDNRWTAKVRECLSRNSRCQERERTRQRNDAQSLSEQHGAR